MLGADQRIWIILQHTDSSWEMKPMSGAPDSDTIAPDEELQLVTWRALYITKQPSGVDGGVAARFGGGRRRRPATCGAPPPPNVQLIVRSVGEHPGAEFDVPDGPALLYSLGADDVFAYIVTNPALPGYLLQRRDGSYKRIIPWPKGIDPANPFKQGLFFGDDGAGDVFYDRDVDGRIVGHDTRDNRDVDLGIRPRFLAWLDHQAAWSPAAADGVRLVPVDGVTPETVLDQDICKPALLAVADGYVYYEVGTTRAQGQARRLRAAAAGLRLRPSAHPHHRHAGRPGRLLDRSGQPLRARRRRRLARRLEVHAARDRVRPSAAGSPACTGSITPRRTRAPATS